MYNLGNDCNLFELESRVLHLQIPDSTQTGSSSAGVVAGAAGATGFAGGFLTGAAVASHFNKHKGGYGGFGGHQ